MSESPLPADSAAGDEPALAATSIPASAPIIPLVIDGVIEAVDTGHLEDGPGLPDGFLPLGAVATVWDPLKDGADDGTDGGAEGGPVGRMARPFVKWAGGKRSLIGEIGKRLPGRIPNYFEPFVGGGGVFFAVADRIEGRAVLIDSVPELMTAYRVIRDQVDELIAALEVLAKRHAADLEAGITGPKHYYYQVRDTGLPDPDNELAVAARFIYLNRTCFNGLYRVNSKGRFNVPMGTYKNPRILDVAGLRAASKALAGAHADLIAGDFGLLAGVHQGGGHGITAPTSPEMIALGTVTGGGGGSGAGGGAGVEVATIAQIEPTLLAPSAPAAGDFVYIDPPYIPLQKTSFTRYTAPNFGQADQERLRDLVLRLTERGVLVMASNSRTAESLALYDDARLRVETVEAPRPVNSRAEGRGPVEEILVTNYEPGATEVGHSK